MAVELASGYVSLSVRVGATSGLGKIFDNAQKQATSAGKKTGEAFAKALASEAKAAEEQVKKLTDTVTKSRDKEADQAGKLKVALEKLNEARQGGVSGSKLTALEESHAAALRKQQAAAQDLAKDLDAVARAQRRATDVQAAVGRAPKNVQNRVSQLLSGSADAAGRAGGLAGRRFGDSFSGALRSTGIVAAGTAVGNLAANAMTKAASFATSGVSAVVTKGLDFEKTMNTLSGVTGASADVMQRFRDTAKALGNDMTLSNTSAADAAQAMTELAKAGFSVDESIAGAKGTLQLAAAAQVDAGKAAEIQANALLAFGLKADYAAKAADVLSNAANASSAEITDVAQALQSGGAVANQFGLKLEDTAAAIGLLANNGIKGSDAGTLLKSALLALTDTSNPAQGAIEELGLTVYDAQGRFVGLEKLFGDLQAASQRMTPEMYQAATTTLFGSDAARLAGIAAKDGAAGYDQMRDAMEKQGSAAKLAAAQNQGLPGVIERLKNAAETLAITLFEKVQGPLSSIGDGLTGFTNKMQDAFENPAVSQAAGNIGAALSGIGAAFGRVLSAVGPALVAGLSNAVNLIVRFKDFLIPLVAGLVAYKTVMLAITVAMKAWAAVQALLNIALTANPIGLIIAAIAGLVAGIVVLYNRNETFRKIVQTTWAAIKAAISAVWNWLSTAVFPGLKLAFTAIGTAATWLWNNAITPAWNGIKAVIGVAWEVVSDIFNNWVRVGQLVGQGAMWLWNNAIQPAWDGIKNAISAAWDFVSPILDKFSAGWDALKSGISSASSAIKDAVTSAFSGLAAVIKAPLKVLGTFLAAIPSEVFGFQIPGADKLNSWGKTLQGFSGGGLVRGPGSGTSDSILAWLSNGEGVVTAKGMKHGAGIVAALNSGWVPSPAYLADMMRAPGYAEGLNPGADYLRSLVMRMWPQIKTIGGRRSEDGYGEHSSGNAIDIMIPDYNTPQGMALGNAIAAMLAKNASALNLNGFIWRQQSYGYGGLFTQGKQMPNRGDDNQNHMNHLHVILGSGRGSGAAAVGLPTSNISLPSGGSVSALGFGGSSGSGASSKQAREADDRITDLSNRLDVTEQELADLESNPKTKETTKQRKRDQVDKLKRDLQQAKDDRAALDLGGSSGGFGGGNNPYAKIMEGISEILPDFGGLADIGIGGLKESLLPPGFSDPMQWGFMQAGSTLLKFFGGLRNVSDGKPLLGEGGALMANITGAAMSGSGSGIVDAIKTIIPAPFGSMDAAQLQGAPGDINPVIAGAQIPGTGFGDMGSAFSQGSAAPNGNGAQVDQSINFNAPVGTGVDQAMQKAQSAQNQQYRRNNGTRTMPS
ncbi:Putative phage tail tape measure protein TMP [Mycobacteroides abscessus subsp. bolletii]|uniref:Phage tail tape measure protein TMP n=2 Tax=Mycobacteroides abscessus TaxID=36809 RepID=A0A9Q7SDH3_9MYCO|nr:phage tail tape measure protein [Mycobacteroides abscessus]SHU23355.1 Putative phage tail tape measure protein TMP [Mycobacteroides abscessus subsp. bolletii]SHV18086.1 Putative phage tail tape measure protein TMP [Mycobacteroides abscessus subsp. bolletii]SHX23564.1 Putative phage tail tape measure protein TMP [Mycobacteroides abscessus subsp. bolletii]SKL35660.1 Putative phage tail tape measure protein TMP [Mycobacteroides abscessus subsp. bolletii]SKM59041.1 Putative phage tail tape meas